MLWTQNQRDLVSAELEVLVADLKAATAAMQSGDKEEISEHAKDLSAWILILSSRIRAAG